jgi:hypothetical protein
MVGLQTDCLVVEAIVEVTVEMVVLRVVVKGDEEVDVNVGANVDIDVGRIGGTKVPGTDCFLTPDVAKEFEMRFDPIAYFK